MSSLVFNTLQSVTVNSIIRIYTDTTTGSTNYIQALPGVNINTYISATGYTHIKIGTNIMYIVSEGSARIYGYFVDNNGRQLASSPYTSTRDTIISPYYVGTFTSSSSPVPATTTIGTYCR
jgi:hypothetical protein